MALTDKQQKFVHEYLKCFNATEAARRAGYNSTNGTLAQIGYENLRKPDIAEKISQHLQESAMSVDEVLMRLAAIARGNIAEYADVENSHDVKELGNKAELIKKFKKQITRRGDITIELELYSAHDALRDIGKRYGLFTDKVDFTGQVENTLVILPPKEDD